MLANPATLPDGRTAYDPAHINAIEPDGNSLLISLRHTDAIYRIDRGDGHVQWKLGGTTTPQSLTVSGDDQTYTLGGQHDVRRLADGTVSVHDNGTNLNRAPRALRFQIDPETMTATVSRSSPTQRSHLPRTSGRSGRSTEPCWRSTSDAAT